MSVASGLSVKMWHLAHFDRLKGSLQVGGRKAASVQKLPSRATSRYVRLAPHS
jgi:hypothetical protein